MPCETTPSHINQPREPGEAGDSTMTDIIYARDLDGTGSLHMCSKEDPGAIAFGDLDSHVDKSVAWDMMCKARDEGYEKGLDEALKVATNVEENGEYFGEASVDASYSIYQQGACEVREVIKALIEALKETAQ